MVAKAKPAAKRSTPKKAGPRITLVSVFGPFGSRVLVEMSRTTLDEMFETSDVALPRRVIQAVENDIAEIGRRAPALVKTGLAATALALAYELDHPGNSATSKSMCAKALNETTEKLIALAPAEAAKDGLDELAAKRTERLSA